MQHHIPIHSGIRFIKFSDAFIMSSCEYYSTFLTKRIFIVYLFKVMDVNTLLYKFSQT